MMIDFDTDNYPKPMFFYSERVSKGDRFKRFIQKIPDSNDFSNINIDDTNISQQDALLFFAQLPDDYKILTTRTEQKCTKRGIGINDVIYNVLFSDESNHIRYMSCKGGDDWKFWKTLVFNKVKFNIYIFTPKINGDHLYNNLINIKDNYNRNHPFRVLSQFSIKKIKNDPYFYALIKRQFTPESSEKTYFDKEFFDGFPGFFKVNFINDVKFKMVYIDENGVHKNIHSIIYILPQIEKILEKGNTIELDASFFVFRPYVYCVPNLIVHNESVPLGFIVGPTEKKDIYSNFYTFLKSVNDELYNTLIKLPVLSDQGAGLIAFTKEFNLKQFFCIRHLLNKFGANTALCAVLKKLLFAADYNEFKHLWKMHQDLIITELNNSSQKRINQFNSLFNINFEQNDKNIEIPEETSLSQSLWERAAYGVPTCSNHSESIHSHLNRLCKTIRKYPKRVVELMKFIESRLNEFKTRRNFRERIAKIKKRANLLMNYDCNCQNDVFLEKLYGEKVPCVHKVKTFEIHYFQDLPFEPNYSFQTEDIISTDWVFQNDKALPEIELTGDEELIKLVYGKPDYKIIKYFGDPKLFNVDTDTKTFSKFIYKAFVNYCSKFYGFYNYEDDSLKWFNVFLKNILMNENTLLIIDYPTKDFLNNIKMLRNICEDVDISKSAELITNSPQPVKRPRRTDTNPLLKLKLKALRELKALESLPPKDFFKELFIKSQEWKDEAGLN